jgi:cytochrome c553
MKSPRLLCLLPPLIIAAAAVAVSANWTEHCVKCHGEDGKGQTKMGRKLDIADLSDAKVQARFSDAQAFKAMKSGLSDDKGKTTMKAAEGLSHDDMKALVACVRKLKK